MTSLEIDQGLAKSALERLESVGAGVAVELADGAAGWPLGAPFDRVVSTYAVERVPWSWIAQHTSGPSRSMRHTISPPCGLYLIALWKRL